MPARAELPEESMAVIRSAYEEYKKKFQDGFTLKESFLNGFLFGMQFGLGVAEVRTQLRQRIMRAFLGEPLDGQG